MISFIILLSFEVVFQENKKLKNKKNKFSILLNIFKNFFFEKYLSIGEGQ